MSPQQVPAEWVDAAELALADRCNDEHEGGRDWCGCPDEGDVRLVLAAVLPLAQAAAQQELITDLLEREMWPMRHENDYPTGAVPKSALLSRRVQIAKRLREGSPS
jgi:hypothetical protein